ncbi:MAG: sulfite exporter TauE/SafE family protein [Hyphomicrobiaceae bacterium]|nr:sulfite exporter TauE/SafE family protein [Hyphomicrobiaceae bacterium]
MMMNIVGFIILGLAAGSISGVIGIGGGTMITPLLVLLFGFTQKTAQGTTLALLVPPIGLLAAMTYYKAGFVNITAGAFIAAGFMIGGYFGSKIAINIPEDLLRKVFAVYLMAIALKLFISK